jgi:hypothetical protein
VLCDACAPQAAAEKLHQQLSMVGQPHSFLIRQLAAAESMAAAAQSELAATKVSRGDWHRDGHRGVPASSVCGALCRYDL